MPTINFTTPAISYTSRDFLSIINDMVRTVPFFTSEWTNLRATDPGIVLLEELAHVADVLHFYVDRALLEPFIDTAVDPQSLISLGKLVDYLPRGPNPSTGSVTFTIATALAGVLTIPAGTRVSTTGSDPVEFITDAAVTIPAGQLSTTATISQGVEANSQVISDNRENQSFLVDVKQVVNNSQVVDIDEGLGFINSPEIESLAFATSTDLVYELQRDADNRNTYIFGDNVNGQIPDAGATIRFTYRTGRGIEGVRS